MWDREEDLRQWQEVEDKFLNILLKRNPTSSVERINWYFKDYDLKLIKPNGEVLTFEVKYDRMTDITGNVAVELSYDWKTSWVMSSTADYFVYYFSNTFRGIQTESLRWLVRWEPKTIFWGDELKSELVLIKKDKFILACKRID